VLVGVLVPSFARLIVCSFGDCEVSVRVSDIVIRTALELITYLVCFIYSIVRVCDRW
jgi:hypothetical protein